MTAYTFAWPDRVDYKITEIERHLAALERQISLQAEIIRDLTELLKDMRKAIEGP